ncbi:hypothetical protein [Pedobacter zeae]|uniref:Uncharacterized protein n=1 Tax=Pedobacter zeae TaxID=1737356 RepID=A0A7W6KB00_9SPHI|nr:hypothetical protein [Pedobacter zeae]MBB4108327.1 hypothetical protein [Pedobacter zeae]GGG93521.1 hypothetical protein GCM10007422_03460 [Pedobacter zeae]
MASLTIDLNYITEDQARQVIKMFDSPEEYQRNFSAIKAITRGMFKLICNERGNHKIKGMFDTVNNLQGILLLEDSQEVERILEASGLMPDVWQSHVPVNINMNDLPVINVDEMYGKKGGESC